MEATLARIVDTREERMRISVKFAYSLSRLTSIFRFPVIKTKGRYLINLAKDFFHQLECFLGETLRGVT